MFTSKKLGKGFEIVLRKSVTVILALTLIFSLGTSVFFAQEKVEIEYWTLLLADAFDDFILGMISDYEKANPNVTVKWVDVGREIDEFLAALAAGTPPDVADIRQIRSVASEGVLHNLDELVPDEAKQKYVSALWQGGLGEYQGNNYAIPWYWQGEGFMYNETLFKEAGLDPDKPPKTTEEMFEYAAIIAKNTDAYGLAWKTNCMHGNHGIPMFLWEDIELFNEEQTEARINNPQAVALLEKYIELYEVGGIPPEAPSATGRDHINWYAEERTAMIVEGAWIARYLSEDLISRTRFAKQPTGAGGSRVFSPGNALVIPKGIENPKEAVKFALFVTNYNNQVEFCKQVAILPTITSAYNDRFFTRPPETFAEEAVRVKIEMIQESEEGIAGININKPMTDRWLEMVDILKREVDQAMVGRQTAAEALKKVEDQWNQLL